MILHLELPPEAAARLEAEAAKRGLSNEDYALHKLLLPEPEPPQEETAGEGILRIARETFWSLPDAELAKLPPDFAINHDHYIHGTPKVEE